MNLGALMAAGGVALQGFNDYRRQAQEDEYRKALNDLTLERTKQQVELGGDELASSKLRRKDAEADIATEKEWAESLGRSLFQAPADGATPSPPPPPAMQRLPDTTAAPAPAPQTLPDTLAQPPEAVPLITRPPMAAGIAPAAPAPAPAGPAAGLSTPGIAPAAPSMTPSVPATKAKPGVPASIGAGANLADFERAFQIAKKNGSTRYMERAIQGAADHARFIFEQQLKGAAAAMAGGDPRPLVQLYNDRYPDGTRIADMRPLADGGVVVSKYGPNGKLVEQAFTAEQMREKLVMMLDPKTWLDMTKERFKLKGETDKELTVEDRKQKGKMEERAVIEAGLDTRKAAELKSEEKRTGMTAGATVAAARIGKEGTIEAAKVRAEGKDPADVQVSKAEGALRYSLTGSSTIATMDPATQRIFDAALADAGAKIRGGMAWEKAATEALAAARKGEKVERAAPSTATGRSYSKLWE